MGFLNEQKKERKKSNTYNSISIANLSIKFFSFDNKKIIVRLKNSTFKSNGSSSISIISGNHTNTNTWTLTLFDSSWYLEPYIEIA